MTKPIQVPEAVWEAFHTAYINAIEAEGATLEIALAAALEKYNELLLGDEAVEAGASILGTPDVWLDEAKKVQQAAINSVLGGGDSE